MKYRIIEFETSDGSIFAISPDNVVAINRERFLTLNITAINVILDIFETLEAACSHIASILAERPPLNFEGICFAKTLVNYSLGDQAERPTAKAATIPYDNLPGAVNNECLEEMFG